MLFETVQNQQKKFLKSSETQNHNKHDNDILLFAYKNLFWSEIKFPFGIFNPDIKK